MANPTWTAPHDVTQYLLYARMMNVIALTTVSFYCAEGIVLGCAVQYLMGSWTLHIVAQDFLSLCQVLSRAVVVILSPFKLTLFSFEFYQFSYTAFIFKLDSKDTGKLLTVKCVTVVHFDDANL